MSDAKFFRVKNWNEYQEYHQRNAKGVPPWIKLSTQFFDDAGVADVPESQRLCLVAVYIMAAKCRNVVPMRPDYIAKRCGLRRRPDLKLFAAKGFIEFLDERLLPIQTVETPTRGEERRGEEITDPVATAPAPPALPLEPPPIIAAPSSDDTATTPGEVTPVESVALAKARVLSAEPSPSWSREAAELWTQEYRGSPPKAFFAALKPLVKRETWERVRPALVTYMAETPAEYVNIAGKFVAAFGTWEARSRGRPPTRASDKARARDASDSVMAMAGLKGGANDGRGVAQGPGRVGRLSAGAGRDTGAEGDEGDGVPPGARRAVG